MSLYSNRKTQNNALKNFPAPNEKNTGALQIHVCFHADGGCGANEAGGAALDKAKRFPYELNPDACGCAVDSMENTKDHRSYDRGQRSIG